jgi:hypothetical protein
LICRLVSSAHPAPLDAECAVERNVLCTDDSPQNPRDCDRWLDGDLHGEFHRSLFEYCDRTEFTNEIDCQRRGPMEAREI